MVILVLKDVLGLMVRRYVVDLKICRYAYDYRFLKETVLISAQFNPSIEGNQIVIQDNKIL